MKLDRAIDDVQTSELDLAKHLRQLAERHAEEQEVYHLGHDLARVGTDHIDRLGPFVERYGAAAIKSDPARPPLPELSGDTLLADLRTVYLVAQRAELDWTILQQAARAARDGELLELIGACHEETEACARWLRTTIKTAAPQALAAG